MPPDTLTQLQQTIEKHWGFHSLRPLQEPAMRAVLEDRDSLVVMPTGGGKSLCFQAPALVRGGTTVVISPLISLMKDQVDALRACGVPAAQIDSSLSPEDRFSVGIDLQEGALRLLYVSPERLVANDFQALLRRSNVRAFAIDEAHCISHWGHDFRPEYRQLLSLRDRFPGVSLHGYTATATERVRQDIVKQLSLKNPEVLVGNFDRPNLNYRVLPRQDLTKQTLHVLERHKNEAGIIYCIRRKDVDEMAAMLKHKGYNALPYHAGMDAAYRNRVQNEFAAERCDLIVATVAFGMGIDRSNIRFILHTGMPKSVEHYQQETGRAGRDGLEAECVLLYSGGDYRTWEYILTKSFEEARADPAVLQSSLRHVKEMEMYCREANCRHRALVAYFGQNLNKDNCNACDLCLGDTEAVADALVVAQKILSCVARVKERYGAGHVISVLRGENTERVRKFGHDRLSTYGLMSDYSKQELRHFVFQLINQEVLAQQDVTLDNGRTVQIVALNEASWEVMRGNRQVRLNVLSKQGEVRSSDVEASSWEGVDRELFEKLRDLRKDIAEEKSVPAYVVFGDKTLREMARYRPSTREKLHYLYGVGEAKLDEFGERFLTVIIEYCRAGDVQMDVPYSPPAPQPARASSSKSVSKTLAFELFGAGSDLDTVVEKTARARSTVMGYLADFIREEKPDSVTTWVADDVYQRIAAAVKKVGGDRLKPIFVELKEQVSYDEIRIVVSHLASVN